MEKVKKYSFDGCEMRVPLRYDEKTGKYMEDYREWFENIVFTPKGHRIMFSGEDACRYAEGIDLGNCPDCGSCRFYMRAGEHSWIGICTNTNKKQKLKKGQEEKT